MNKVSCSPRGSGKKSKGKFKVVAIITNRRRLYHRNRLFSWFKHRNKDNRPLDCFLFHIGSNRNFYCISFSSKNDCKRSTGRIVLLLCQKGLRIWAGFSCGWNYWCSNILIMGSQLTALSILSRFWFPNTPCGFLLQVTRFSLLLLF